MKKYRLLLPLFSLLMALAACSDTSVRPGCRIKGESSFKEYKTVYLVAPAGNRIDSCQVQDGKFYLETADTISSPYVATIQMTAEEDSTDQLIMPVAIENGTVKVGLGEYIQLSGTPLNARLKEFLDALQHCKDGVETNEGITAEEVSSIFSEFYKQQILSNKDNAIGQFIYACYGTHLNAADKEQIQSNK